MSANSLELFASGGKGKSTRTLLRVVILFFIAGAAIASRLFSVIRKYLSSPACSSSSVSFTVAIDYLPVDSALLYCQLQVVICFADTFVHRIREYYP